MSGLTERVARALSPRPWTDALRDARAAQGAVADDVDGLAGVLRAHKYDGTDANGVMYCRCDTVIEDLDAHKAEQLAAHIRDGAA